MRQGRARWGWAALLLAASTNAAALVETIWRQDWTVQAPPTVTVANRGSPPVQFPATLKFSTGGDLFLAGLAYFGEQSNIFRLRADGVLQWAAHFPVGQWEPPPDLWPAADGGAFVSKYPYVGLLKFDSEGKLQWTRRIAAQRLAHLPGGLLVAGTCKHLTALDPQTGHAEWQRTLPVRGSENQCEMSGMQALGDTGLVFSIESYSVAPLRVSTVYKTDELGAVRWQYTHASPGLVLRGVDAERVFLSSNTSILALDAKNGTLLWQSASAAGQVVLVDGNPAIPTIVDADSVTALVPTSGAELWTRPLPGAGLASAVGNAVLVHATDGLVKVNAQDGSLQWTASLPSTDSLDNPVVEILGMGGLAQGKFFVVTRVAASAGQPAPFVQPLDFLSGQLLPAVSLPSISQGSSGSSLLAQEHVYSFVSEQDSVAARYRISKLDAMDGTQLWSSTEPPFAPSILNTSAGAGGTLAVRDGLVVAAIGEGYFPESCVGVAAWRDEDGAPLWRTQLSPTDGSWRNTSISDPMIDAAADV